MSVETNRARPTHKHRSSRGNDRLWLEAVHGEAATMRLHAYCVDCGAVESTLPTRGRTMGYFERALSNMKASLEDHPEYRKLAQVQSHLIQKALAAVPDFGDPYSMPFETQRSLFLHAVQEVRPDLGADFVDATLPREPQRLRSTFLRFIVPEKGGLLPSDAPLR